MKPQALLNRLARLEFCATQQWDGSYQVRINRQISGLPERVAQMIALRLSQAVETIRLEINQEINNDAKAKQTDIFDGVTVVDKSLDTTESPDDISALLPISMR